MKKKTSILKIFIFTLGIAPSFSLFPSYKPSQRKPGNRPQNYTGPMPAKPIFQAPIVKPIQEQPTIDVPSKTPKKEPVKSEGIEKEEAEEDEQPKPETSSDVKEAQKDLARPGFLANIYATIVPLILITLDKAIGTGAAASTKNFINSFLTRRKFFNQKNDILAEVNKKLKPEFKNISDEEKLESGKALLLTEKDIQTFDKLEKETTISAIVAQTAHIFLLNTIARAMETLFGYTIKVGLSSLMPDQK